MPVFDTDEDRSFFEVVIPIHPVFLREEKGGAKSDVKGGAKSDVKGGAKSGVKVGGKPHEKTRVKITPRQMEVLELIQSDPTVSYREVAQQMGINDSAVQKHFNNLKKKGVIKHIGPAKGGRWQVIKKK